MSELAMKQDLPPLNWLRSFESAARHLSFTQAANELGLSQVAVSKQIKQLEGHLNEQLFVRHARSLELTKAAEAYLPKVRDAFERLADGTYEVFGKRKSKILTIRAAVAFSVNWLAPKLELFRNLHPNIPIRLISSIWNEDDLKAEYDFDIRYGKGNWSGMQTDRLTWETISPVCSPAIIQNDEPLTVSDIENLTLIHVLGYQEGWARWLHAAGATNISIERNIQVDTSLLAFEFAKRGTGIAIARSSLAEQDIAAKQLIYPFSFKVPIEEAFHLVSTADGHKHPHAAVFRNWLLEQV